MNQQGPERPARKLRAGGMGMAIWANPFVQDGRTFVRYSARLEKRYWDKRTQTWQDSDSLFVDDLPKLILLALKAYEYMVLADKTSDVVPEAGSPEDASLPGS